MRFLFLIFLLSIVKVFKCDNSSSTLEFVEIWFRHGERLSTHYIRYPYEIDDDCYLDIAEKGELTQRGVQQEYQLGVKLKSIYGNFLPKYQPSTIHIWTGKDNRTVSSALAFMEGFYPNTQQYPVAVHTDPSIDWLSTGVENECPEWEKILKSEESPKIMAQMPQEFIKIMEKNTRISQISDVFELNHVFDSIITRYWLNNSCLQLPQWAYKIMDEAMQIHSLNHRKIIESQEKYVGAYQIEMLLSYIEDHIQRSNNKAVFISGHDSNLLTLGIMLSLPDMQSLPKYASHLSVELHKKNEIYYIELWFSFGLNEPRRQQIISQCGNPCPLTTLQKIYKDRRMTKEIFYEKCKGLKKIDPDSNIITGSMMVLLAILLLSTIVLSCTTCSYRRQIRILQDPERQSLINMS